MRMTLRKPSMPPPSVGVAMGISNTHGSITVVKKES
jgi:hypothetical protein